MIRVGTKVQVRPDIELHRRHVVQDMLKYAGKYFEVDYIDPYNDLVRLKGGEGWWWDQRDLIAKPKPSPFQTWETNVKLAELFRVG